jgi:hypothetical protein
MRYTYTSLHHIRGLNPWPSATDKEIYRALDGTIHALLICDPTAHSEKLDTSLALGTMLLSGLVGRTDNDGTVEERVAREVQRMREERAKTFGARSVFLLFQASGEVADVTPSSSHEAAEFLIWIDGAPKRDILQMHESQVRKILSTISIAFESVVGFQKVADGTVFLREGVTKPIYSFTVETGVADVIVSRVPGVEAFASARQLAATILNENGSDRVLRLLNDSLDPNQDTLRRFLSAWMALEVFVNQNFVAYENRFWNSLSDGVAPPIRDQYLKRIHEVMRDKYKMQDKFAVLSAELDPTSANDDIEIFKRAKHCATSLHTANPSVRRLCRLSPFSDSYESSCGYT